MSIFIDLLLVAVFVFFAILFTKYGFARTAKKIGKTWLSVFCSMVLGPWVAGKLETLFLRKAITAGFNNTLTKLVENNPNDYDLAQLFARLPEGFVKFLNGYGINFADLEAEFGSSTTATTDIIRAISEKMATPCVGMISSIVGHVICFVVPLILFAWLDVQIRNRKYPFLRYVDHVSGFVVGATVGYCAAWGIAVVLYTMFQVVVCFDANSVVTKIYTNSYVFRFLNEFNTIEFLKKTLMTLASKVS